MRAFGQINCAELQRVETIVLHEYEKHVYGWGRKRTCPVLRGWDVREHQQTLADYKCLSGWWIDDPSDEKGGFCAGGYTHVEKRMIELDTFRDLQGRSFAHEVAHVLSVELGTGVGHCRWKQRGIKAAILQATNRVDETTEEASCQWRVE